MKVETIRSIGGILIGSAAILLVAANLEIATALPSVAALSSGSYLLATNTPSLREVEQPRVSQVGQVEPEHTQPAPAAPIPTALPQVEQPPVEQPGQVEQPPVEQPGQVEQPELDPMCASGNPDPYCNLPVLTLNNDAPIGAAGNPTMTAEQQAYSRRRTR